MANSVEGRLLRWPVERWLKLSSLALLSTGGISYALILVYEAKGSRIVHLPWFNGMNVITRCFDGLDSLVGVILISLAFYGCGHIVGIAKQKLPKAGPATAADIIALAGVLAIIDSIMISAYLLKALFYATPENEIGFQGLWTALQTFNTLREIARLISFGLALVGAAQVINRLAGKRREQRNHEP